MNKGKEILVTAFALFSLFFGAGNLILPPYLGFKAGVSWWLVTLGFSISAVIIPVLGIIAHARLQGTMFDFARKVSPSFSLMYCYAVYAISVSLPSPRTASVTHEMAIRPMLSISPLVTSILYFTIVFIFVMNRSKILDIVGKLLTPAILLILIAILGSTLLTLPMALAESRIPNPLSHGILEGYQTFDAIGAVVVGGVIIISINLKSGEATYGEKRSLITRAGWLAGAGLLLIYTGLSLATAVMHQDFDPDTGRTALLSGISRIALGNTANVFLSLLIALACFTTAVGIVTGSADFVRSRFGDSSRAYTLTAVFGCLLGVLVGQFDVNLIITIAFPALMFIYPVTIVLILLNVAPDKWATPLVFRTVIAATLLFSIPDFSGSVGWTIPASFLEWIPLSAHRLGWVLPAVLSFLAANVYRYYRGMG